MGVQAGLLLFTIGSLLCSLSPGLGWLVGFRCSRRWAEVLIVVVLAGLTAGIIEGPQRGWGSPLIGCCFGAALLAGIGVVIAERHRREPMIDPRFFASVPFPGRR